MAKPVEFEIIMRDGTREGIQGASVNVEALSAKINEQKSLIVSLEQELSSMQTKLQQATNVSNVDDIAAIEALQNKIKELQASLIELENQKEKGNSTPIIPPIDNQLGKATKGVNNLSFSVQQVARELPSLAMGPQMFFLAISNNLPILSDQIKIASAEYKAMVAAGQKGTPVWKQLVSSMLSWQTAMVVGITLLVVYGKDIVNWTQKLFGAEEAIIKVTSAQEALNAARIKGDANAQNEITKLKILYKAATDVSRSTSERKAAVDKLQELYPSYFKNLSDETIMAGNALSVYKQLSVAIVEAARARAKGDQVSKMATEQWGNEMKRAGTLMEIQDARVLLQQRLKERDEVAKMEKGQDKAQRQKEVKSTVRIAQDNLEGKIRQYNKYTTAINDSQKAQEQLSKSINIKDYVSDPGKTPKPQKQTNTENLTDKIADATVKAQQRITALNIAAMEEGAAKEKAVARAKFDEEIDRIDQEERDRLQALAKAKKMGLSVSPEQVNTVTDQANTQRQLATNDYVKSFSDIEEKTKKQEKELWDEINVHFKSGLDQRLHDIDKNYDAQVEKAKGNKQIIDALNSNRDQDKKVEKNKSNLDELDYSEQVELQRREIQLRGLASDEYVEQQRNAIILKYAKARIKILETMTDDNSKKELGLLKNTVPGLEKDSKPKTLKGIVDTKAIEALTKHFVKLGNSEEEAKTKAENFATGFTKKMQLASEVTGTLKSAFGGIDKNLDMALDAVDNIASGFANGGIVGGIAAAAQTVISVTKNLLTARKEMDVGMVAEYKVYIETLNDLIDKQIDLLDKLGGNDFGKNIVKTTNDIQNEIKAARNLLAEAASANSSTFTRSYGYRMNETLSSYRRQLQQIGIYTTDWSKMTDEQLIKLKEIPELYAKLPEQMRTYIDDLSSATDKLEEFKQQVQETILGFDFSSITEMIVDSVTDSSINDALGDLSGNVDKTISDIVKKMLTRNLLTNQIQKLLSDLVDNMTVKDHAGKITGYDLKEDAAKQFASGVMALGSEYKDAYEKLKAQFKAAGIDFDEANNVSQSAQSGTISTISEETGSKLEGTMVALLNRSAGMDDKLGDISKLMSAALAPLLQIAENTLGCKRLDDIADHIETIIRDGITAKLK